MNGRSKIIFIFVYNLHFMAQVKDNILTKGLSGRVGRSIVFKNYGSKTVVSAYPDMSNVEPSAKQKKENSRFRKAMAYAKIQMADPVARAAYKKKATGLQKAHNVAIADFYHPPEIGHVDVSIGKTGQADRIFIEATDDFSVVKVEVTIIGQEGSKKESGQTMLLSEGRWLYVVQGVYPSVDGLKIIIKAWDRPGNCTEKVLES
jgi:hypothetical protein